jgi:hypothetical protein
MCFFLICTVEGALDTARLARALHQAAGRHPLVRSRIAGCWWRPAWREPDSDPEFLAYPSGARVPAPDEPSFPWRPLDIRRSSGVRMVAIERAQDAWEVVLMVQHSVCDGLAGTEFLGDVWSHYHGSQPAPFRTPTRVARRVSGTSATPLPAPPAGSHEPPGGLRGETAKFAGFIPAMVARGPAEIAPGERGSSRPPAGSAGPNVPFVTLGFTREQTASIKLRAAAAGASLNDVAIAAVMRAVAAWNENAGHPARQIRITMPASLKPPGTRAAACNEMGYAFLDRTAAECRNPADLVGSVAFASRWIQEHRAANAFLETLSIIDRFPPAFWLLTRIPLPLSTAVVSCIGNVGPRMRANVPRDGGCDLPGDVRITAVAGVPPIRPGTRLGVGLVIYDGRLHLTTACAAAVVGGSAQFLLAESIRAEILACADALPQSPDRLPTGMPDDDA